MPENAEDGLEPAAGSSILPSFARLEEKLRRKEDKAEIESNRALSSASQRLDSRLAARRKEIRATEAARRKQIAEEVVAAAQKQLETELEALEQLDARFLRKKDQAVRSGLAWLLGEKTP